MIRSDPQQCGLRLAVVATLCLGGLLAGRTVPFAQPAPEERRIEQRWELSIRPIASHFRRLTDVHLLLTLTNLSETTQSVMLPYLETHLWYQWVEVSQEEDILQNCPDEDYWFLSGAVRPGERLSMLVRLERFVCGPGLETGSGRYRVQWNGGTIGFAETVSAEFTVDPEGSQTPDSRSLSYYLGDTPETPKLLWTKILESPSDPKWIPLLRSLSPDELDAPALLRLIEETADLGIRREAVRALGRVGKRVKLVPALTALLKMQEDGPLLELGKLTLQQLQGEGGPE